ncbi:MAG TPA: AMP-binding protein [Luteolibacter sp.]|nr:AMP-binding protein [Luteolibacter sp.]
MDAASLIADAFWRSDAPVAMAAAGTAAPDLAQAPGLICFQTSGSTAAPKWIGHTRGGLLRSAQVVNAHLAVEASSCWGLLLPLHHVGGFGVAARARQAGCRLAVFDARWNAAAAAAWLERERVTHTSMVPTQVFDLVSAGVCAPGTLVAVVVGGGHLPLELGSKARELGWPVLASYGMTEAASQIATQGLDALDRIYQPSPLPVLPHWRLQVDGEGVLSLAGESLFAGQLVQQGAVWVYQPREASCWRSSDRVELQDNLLTPLGRADLQVKVLGELVDLEAIERQLVELAAGQLAGNDLIVVALPDERSGHRLLPVFDAACDPALVADVLAAHAAAAPGYTRLSAPMFLADFPRSPLGKPVRRECAAQCRVRSGK